MSGTNATILVVTVGILVACGHSPAVEVAGFSDSFSFPKIGRIAKTKKSAPAANGEGGKIQPVDARRRTPLVAGPAPPDSTPSTLITSPEVEVAAAVPQRPKRNPDPMARIRVIAPAALPPSVGERTYAIEKVDCAPPNQARIRFFSGKTEAYEKRNEAIKMRVEKRFFMQFQANKNGIDSTKSFCVPTQKYCWEKTGFDEFGGADFSVGDTASFQIYAGGYNNVGLMAMIDYAVWKKCGYIE